MKNTKQKLSRRIVAVVAAVVMVLSMVPFSFLAFAAEEAQADGITIVVKDQRGVPVSGAVVRYEGGMEGPYTVYADSPTVTTDENGVAKIVFSDWNDATYAMFTASAVVEAEGYKMNFMWLDETFQSLNPTYEVELESDGNAAINGVTLEPIADLVYNGSEQELFKLNGIKDGDTYEVFFNGSAKAQKTLPTAKNAGEYTCKVVVSHEGFADLELNATATIAKGTFNASITYVTGDDGQYLEEIEYAEGVTQALVAFEGFERKGNTEEFYIGDEKLNIEWKLNGETVDFPKAEAAATYEVTGTIKRENYNDCILGPITVSIVIPLKDLGDLKIEPLNLVYNGEAQELIKVSGDEGFKLEYRVDGKKSSGIPKKTDAGEYSVEVKVRANTQNSGARTFRMTSKITPKKQAIKFANEQEATVVVTDYSQFGTLTYDFAAIAANEGDELVGNLTYAVEQIDEDEPVNATIDENGLLTVTGPSKMRVVAKLASTNANYTSCETSFEMTVSFEGLRANVTYDHIPYVVGTSNVVMNAPNVQTGYMNAEDMFVPVIGNGKVSFSFEGEAPAGLAVDPTTGVVTVTDYEALIASLAVVASENGQKSKDFYVCATFAGTDTFNSAAVNYSQEIVLVDAPENAYTLQLPDENSVMKDAEPDGKNGWYKSYPALVPTTQKKTVPVEGVEGGTQEVDVPYLVAKTIDGADADGAFGTLYTFDEADQGDNYYYFYLRNSETKAISRVGVSVKLDAGVPTADELKIKTKEFHNLDDFVLFFNETVELTVSATDHVSQIAAVELRVYDEYNDDKILYSQNFDMTDKSRVDLLDGSYQLTETIAIPSEFGDLRGRVHFVAIDEAGNVSELCGDGFVTVIDTIAPEFTVKYQGQAPYEAAQGHGNEGEEHFFDGNVEVTLSIKEANFYHDQVIVKTSKDGEKAVEVEAENIVWIEGTDKNGAAVHKGSFVLSEEGEYVLTVEYKDYNDHAMVGDENAAVTEGVYTSDIITVDRTAPVLESVEFPEAENVLDKDEATRNYYYNTVVENEDGSFTVTGEVEVVFTVTERHFYGEDIVVSVKKDDEAPAQVAVTWEEDDDEETPYTYVGSVVLSGDGDYVLTLSYADRAGNKMTTENDDLDVTENGLYTSDTHTIDTILPVVNVNYKNNSPINTLLDSEEYARQYFDAPQEALLIVEDHNLLFVPDENDEGLGELPGVEIVVTTTDVAGNKVEANWSQTRWTKNGDVYSCSVKYLGDANYTFDVVCTDLANNASADYATDRFTVDTAAPTDLQVSYSSSLFDTILETVSFGYYNAKVTVTIQATDVTGGVHSFLYDYKNAEGVSAVNAELLKQAIEAAAITYSDDGSVATATFEIPRDVLTANTQFNGTISFTATDRSGNESVKFADDKRIVVDNIAPTATVNFNEPVNRVGDISYYDGNILATINVHEANFFAEDVQVLVAKDGGTPTAVTPTWVHTSVDDHIGTFTLQEDGDYIVTVNYTDKSKNTMTPFTSNQLTIDTDIQAPTYTINGTPKTEVGGAYKNDVRVGLSFSDPNAASYTVKLTRSRFDKIEDVTDQFVNVYAGSESGSATFDIPSVVENDGIYILTVSFSDHAMHSVESSLKFTVNRYGSVYEYGEYMSSLIKDGGSFVTAKDGEAAVSKDLVITEFNADPILKDSLKILITRDGQTVETKCDVTPSASNDAINGTQSGWYTYVYVIKKENFAEDGLYKITLTSKYATDDSAENDSTSVPDNSVYADGQPVLDSMSFTVDTTAPQIRNVVNLESAIIDAQTVEVKYNIVDVGGLSKVEILVDGQVIDTVTEFGEGLLNYSGAFTLNESNDVQTIRIRAIDRAGNIVDTADSDFTTNDLYVFNDEVTVSTNFFVRWYANKPLFWGSMAGILAVIVAIFAAVAIKKKKTAK